MRTPGVRILYQHRTFADGAEGVHIAAMVDAFRALGHEVRVMGVAAGGATSPTSTAAARLKQAMPAPLMELATFAVNAPEYVATLAEIRRFRPDLLYKRHARFDVAALAAARQAGVPAVLEVNCLFSQPPYVEFEPMTFELEVADSARVMDAEGRLMPSVVAKPVSELKLQMEESKQESEENLLMRAIAADQNSSIANLAIKCGFIGITGQPQKSKVHKMCGRLVEEKLLERRGNKYRITPKGKREIGWTDDDDD